MEFADSHLSETHSHLFETNSVIFVAKAVIFCFECGDSLFRMRGFFLIKKSWCVLDAGALFKDEYGDFFG